MWPFRFLEAGPSMGSDMERPGPGRGGGFRVAREQWIALGGSGSDLAIEQRVASDVPLGGRPDFGVAFGE